nr:hypothetical protein CFP56_22199 [Quercus suber]
MAAGEAVKPIQDLDLETKDASGAVAENAGEAQNINAGHEEEATSTADASSKHADKHEEHEVPLKSQTGETSSVSQMTTAAGEPVKPIEDADVEAHDALTATTSKLDIDGIVAHAAHPAAEGKANAGDDEAEGSTVGTTAEESLAIDVNAGTSSANEIEAVEGDSSNKDDKSDETTKGVQGLEITEEQHEQPETQTQTQDAKAPEHAQESVKD